MSSLSVVLCVKNGEKTLKRCLESVKWADEIIVVDDQSTDRTIEICREYTGTIYTHAMTDFSSQRGFALEKAAGPWILSVDADDEVTEPLAQEIRRAVRSETAAYSGYTVIRTTSYLGRWMRYAGWSNRMLSLFRKDTARYDGKRVHEKVIVDGRIGSLSGRIRHHAYSSLSDHFIRMDAYTSLDAQTFWERGLRIRPIAYPVYFMIRPAYAFVRKYILQQAFREGVRGLFISAVTSFVVFMNYAKLWEMQLKNKERRS